MKPHPSLAKRFLIRLQSIQLLENGYSVPLSILILCVWLAAVIFVAARHEFWRDEVRALSLAQAAGSPLDLFGLIRHEGHPILWYLLLYIGNLIIGSPLVLPIMSILVAFLAVCIFTLFSPFPLWMKTLFIFSALPFYEYSVMARNYGISMLLLFLAAALYRYRKKHPLGLACTLALLANTNIHSAIFSIAVTGIWIWDVIEGRKTKSILGITRSLLFPLVIIGGGLLLCAVVVFPERNTILTGVYSIHKIDLANALIKAAERPDLLFKDILPVLSPLLGIGLLYLAIAGLLHRFPLFLAALGSQILLGVFFIVGYSGYYRHQGLLLIFYIFLYWLAMESIKEKTPTKKLHWLFNAGLYGSVLILILTNFYFVGNKVSVDIREEMSSSAAFGVYLNASETYRQAILVPEPDYLIESLPYYADNEIYFPREHRFGKTVSWTTEAEAHLSLGELITTARNLKAQYGRPVLIVLGHWKMDNAQSGDIIFSYNKYFSWTPEELREADQLLSLVATFDSAVGDENYRVYIVN